jgi:hypothetical protein
VNQLPSQCPICGAGNLAITGFYCRECDTRVEGRFVAHVPFAQLTPEQLHFVETFVRCEGKITRVEEELGLSYPTIRGRLHDVIRALGYEPGQEEPPAVKSESERRQILDRLEAGEIAYDEAMRLLQGG